MTKPESRRVLVTGAAGFVGRALCRRLLSDGFSVIAVVRNPADFPEFSGASFDQAVVGDLAGFEEWPPLLEGVGLVFHLAARAHVMHEEGVRALALYRAANAIPTARLAEAAAQAGVARMIFLSSIKVNGEQSGEMPFRPEDAPSPQDAYGFSKQEAEEVLRNTTIGSGMEHVVIRSPLVYGPDVRANFLRLLRWVERGIPLPFADVNNRRSLIYLGNLVDAMQLAALHPAARNRTYLVSDGMDISTPGLISSIASAMGKPARLWPCPDVLLRLGARCVGKASEAERLLGSLQVNASRIKDELGWMPPYTMQQGLNETVRWYKNEKTV